MQPNDQQGFYRPDQEQTGQPVGPPQSQLNSTGQSSGVDPAEFQAALNEPESIQSSPLPSVEPLPQEVPDEMNEDEVADDVPPDEPVTWIAHEYIHREKGTVWFTLFSVVIVALLGLSIWTKAWTFAVLIVVIAVVIILISRRPPRELTYSLTDDGLTIDNTLHKFEGFKSFGIVRDGDEFSVMLIPVQRFQPGISVYFPEESGEAIVDMLGSRLPMKELHLDVVDRIVRALRL